MGFLLGNDRRQRVGKRLLHKAETAGGYDSRSDTYFPPQLIAQQSLH
jgi:hypothetical protein